MELKAHPSVISVDPDSFSCISEKSSVLGVGFVMDQVGAPISCEEAKLPAVLRALLQSLHSLHALGYNHGDARLANALRYEDRIVWVDFLFSNRYELHVSQRQHDVRVLLQSVFPARFHRTDSLDSLVRNQYNPTDVNSIDSLLRALALGD